LEQLNKLQNGIIILPCEGEGGNEIYAASQEMAVNAFDACNTGKSKALQLSRKMGVSIDYKTVDAATVNYPENSADAVIFIYAHFPAVTSKQIHQKAIGWLKPGGKIIVEAFNPAQL
jgi:hypothetical protein